MTLRAVASNAVEEDSRALLNLNIEGVGVGAGVGDRGCASLGEICEFG